MRPSPTPPDTCIAFLVRHGATENNIANPPLLQGCGVDHGLSAAGHQQAEQAGRFLADQPLAAVYSSPLLRAMETAVAISHPHKLDARAVADLKEVDVGRWESRSWAEISQTEPEAYEQFMTDASLFGYPEGENMIQLLKRVEPAMERLMASNLGRRIVIVAHNVVSRVFLAHLLGVPLPKSRRVSHNNCGISVLSYRNGKTKLRTLNSTFHLNGSD